jgi:DNA repair protein RecO (recombination protein O)
LKISSWELNPQLATHNPQLATRMISKTRGIVFHHIKYSDSSLIATVFTENSGRKSFLVKGVYKSKSRFKANLFQPLSLLEMEISISPKRELQHLREVSSAHPMVNLYGDYHKQSLVFFISEVLYKTVREEEPNRPLFDFLFHTILYLDAAEGDIANFHLVFLLQLTRFLGFFPRNDFSGNHNRFNALNGYFVTELDTDVHTYGDRLSEKLHLLLNLNYETSSQLSLNRTERMELVEMMIDFYRLHLQGNLNIQSLQVLKELFD